jgi:hypothetical protein
MGAAAEVGVLDAIKREQRALDAADLAQRLGKPILARIGRQLLSMADDVVVPVRIEVANRFGLLKPCAAAMRASDSVRPGRNPSCRACSSRACCNALIGVVPRRRWNAICNARTPQPAASAISARVSGVSAWARMKAAAVPVNG